MPAKPYQDYTVDYNTLMREAKDSLARANALSAEVDTPAPTHTPYDSLEPVKRLFRNFKEAILPTDRSSDVTEGISYTARHPIEAAKLLYGADADARAAQADKAKTAPSLLEKLGHTAASYLPVIGPAAAGAGEQFAEGDIAGGLGKTAGLLAPFALHGLSKIGGEWERPIARVPGIGETTPNLPFAERQLPQGFDELNKVIHEEPPQPPGPTRHPLDLFDTPGYQDAPAPFQSPELPASEPVVEPPVQEPAPFVSNEQPAVSTKPKLSANEVAKMLQGREKFKSANPDVDLAPGMRDELDRSGLEYNRTQSELKRLLGMADADPAEVSRMRQGARELGSRLRRGAKDAASPPPPSETGLSVIDSMESGPEFSSEQVKPQWNEVNDLLRGLGTKLRDVPTSKARLAEMAAEDAAAGVEPDLPKFAGFSKTEAASKPAPSLKDMLQASLKQQAADSLPPERAGHFKLPEPGYTLPEEEQLRMLEETGARADKKYDTINDRRSANVGRAAGERRSPAPGDLGRAVEPGAPYDPAVDSPSVPQQFTNEFGPDLNSLLNDERGFVDLSGLKPTPEKMKRLGGMAQAHQAGSLLFSPLTVPRIAISNTASALMKAAEHSANERSLAPMGRTLKELLNVKQMGADAIDAFKNPHTKYSRDSVPYPSGGLFDVASRAVGAVDAPFRNAMERAGFPSEDALTVTQQRSPITEFGKGAVRFQQGSTASRLLIPFLKAKMNEFETGLVEPLQSAGRLVTGEGTGADAVKTGLGAGAGALGYAASDKLDELPGPVRALLMAMGGLYNAPLAMGYAAGKSKDGFQAMYNALVNSLPLASGFSMDPKTQMNRVIPRALNPDYWTGTQRDAQTMPQKLEAQIPGLAQTLPEKPTTHRAKRAKHAR